jgi:hypothetical protein
MATANNRTPNWKLPRLITDYQPFTNYNHSIRADKVENIYSITHWTTNILTLDVDTNKILFLETRSISQTTSTLVGRILRALPRTSVLDFLATAEISTATKRRLSKMCWNT